MMQKDVHPLVARLVEERVGQGLSRKELATRAGYTPSHIGRIEGGGQRLPIDVATDLASALGLRLALLRDLSRGRER